MATMTTTKISQLDRKTTAMLDKKLSRAKGQLFAMPGASFLASLLCNHKFVWDLNCNTAWCNGTTIGYNPNFFLSLIPPARVMLTAHELWHTGFGHMTRLNGRCPVIWNQAADYVINNMLDDQGYCFTMPIGDDGKPFEPCLDHQYDKMTTEQVYDLLISEGGIPFNPDPSGYPMSGDIKQVTSDKIKGTIQGTIVQAQQAAQRSNNAGDLPGEVVLHIDKFLRPKLPWRQLLRKFFTALSADDYSWRRPSRRYDEYLPSLIGDNGLEHIIYYIDVSGSITDAQALRANSEVRSIHNNLKPQKLTIVMFDTEIHEVYEFTKDQSFEEIEITGRGGTSLVCVYDHIMEHKPTAAVVFSDMHVTPMVDDPGVPLLWVVMDNVKAQVPFGKIIHLEREDL